MRLTDRDLIKQLNFIAANLDSEINSEENVDRNCRLQEAKELVRQAFHAVMARLDEVRR